MAIKGSVDLVLFYILKSTKPCGIYVCIYKKGTYVPFCYLFNAIIFFFYLFVFVVPAYCVINLEIIPGLTGFLSSSLGGLICVV